MNQSISNTYTLVWQLKDATEYKFTRCKNERNYGLCNQKITL
jgi:hypothetical protein